MNQPRAANENATSVSRHEAVEIVEPALAHLTILVATAEPAISASMRDLLAAYPLRTIWTRGVDGVRAALSRETVDACFCGFWLIDGTYREERWGTPPLDRPIFFFELDDETVWGATARILVQLLSLATGAES